MRRVLTTLAALLLLLTVGAVTGLLWLVLHPASPWVERVAGWPGLAPVAEMIRSLGPPVVPVEVERERDGSAVPEEPPEPPEPPSAGPFGALQVRLGAWGRVWVTPGTRLLAAPRDGVPEVTVLSLYANLAVIERRPGWIKVRFRDATGWVADQGDLSGSEPPLGSDPEPVLPLPARPPDPERLALARARLTPPETAGQLGPYPLHTDVHDATRLRFLDRVAGQVEELYRSRYGREPVGRPAEVVVLFADEATFRDFLTEDAGLAGLPATGHNSHGIVALFDGGRSAGEVGGTLVHELVHLLNRRSVGPLLPSWLDEGIAHDLAGSRIDPDGTLDPAALGGATLRYERLVRWTGARGSLQRLADTADREALRPLPELLALEWDDFVRRNGDLNYAHAAFWIRYLLEGEDGALAPGFRAFLAAVAAGGAPDPEALRQRLGRSWGELEAGFRAWLPALRAVQ